LIWFLFFKVQDNKIQIGVKKVVNNIINNDNPSIPKIILLFVENNQFISSKNWKHHENVLKKPNKKIEQLKTNKDQNKEKFLIKTKLFFSTKKRKIAPIKGNTIKEDNI